MVGTGQIQCRADYAPGLAGPEVGWTVGQDCAGWL